MGGKLLDKCIKKDKKEHACYRYFGIEKQSHYSKYLYQNIDIVFLILKYQLFSMVGTNGCNF